MQKDYFYNDKSINENKDNKRAFKLEKKKIVDINILLNKVKTEQQIERSRNHLKEVA